MSADRISPLFGASFGALLRRYRDAAGLTQEDLAERAGLSARGVSDLERGLRQTPRRETVELLAEALGLAPRQRALLHAAARPHLASVPPSGDAVALPATPHNLPAQLTPLVGREREVRAAAELLARAGARLVTLTGPGGVGKTRLALQVAEDALARFEDGVYAVLLAPLRDPALVPQAIADAVGLRVTAGEPLARQVAASLRGRRVLLVLDNCEHVLAAASQIAALLADCPLLTVLATSREPLKIAGEHELAVGPLGDDAASELFARCARAANPALELGPADGALVAEICRQVDRLPLAIELAAVWARVLPLPALLERLERRLDLLAGGRRDAPERQRTLRDTIAWSEHLLEEGERRLFRRLAVFAGGWTLDAAEAICGGVGQDSESADGVAGDVLDGLARLVEKSLVQAEPAPGWIRFAMLETIREYALERLAESGEAGTLRRRHAEYYARVAAELGWVGPDQDARDRRLERDLPNARAALAWTVESHEPALGLQLATPLGRWWYTRGVFDEGEGWLRALLDSDAEAGEHAAPPGLRVAALYALILFALDRHRYDEAEAMAREGLALAQRHGDAARAGNMLAELGHVAEARGDLDAAMTCFEDALAQYEHGGEGAAVGRTLSSLGNLARARGEYRRAREYLERALAWARERDFSFAVASGLVSLGHVALEQGDHARAAALYRDALALFRTLRNPASLAWCLEGVAVVAASAGDYEGTARLCGAVAGLRASAGATDAADWRPFAAALDAARDALGAEGFAAAYDEGTALSAEGAVAAGLACLDRREVR